MTAINAFTRRGEAFLLTDGGTFNHWTGVLAEVRTKTIVLKNIRAAVSLSGVPNWDAYREWLPRYSDQASMLAQLPELAEKAQAQMIKAGPNGEDLVAPVYMYVALFDRRDGKPKLYSYSSDRGPDGTQWPGLWPVKASMQPRPPSSFTAADLADAGRFDVKRDAVALLEAQRRVQVLGTSRVGGFVELTRVGRWGIRQKVLHRWRQDVVGQPIAV